MHFLVFIPHSQRSEAFSPNSAEHLRHVGLADFIPNALATAIPPGLGFPTEEGGTRYHWDAKEQSINCDPAALRWIPAEPLFGRPAERYWIGYRADEPPTPDELQRRDCPLALFTWPRKWETWALPAAARVPMDYVMPRGTGQVIGEVPARWKEFWDRAVSVQKQLALTAIDEAHDDADQASKVLEKQGAAWWEFTHFVFNIAYRMPVELLWDLRILNSENRVMPLLIATGGVMSDEIAAAVAEAMKKKSPVTTGTGVNTSPGVEDSAPITGPTLSISA